MKNEKNFLVAFILNLLFSVFELFGGIFTGSVAILSDAVHDIGDAASIGIAFAFEKKSKRPPDEKYTYGYIGYSLIGSLITTLILIFGSIAVIYNAIEKIISPAEINYNGMIVFAVIGVTVNLAATLLTRGSRSLNQKAVNLHMLEDVLGWTVVLIGAVLMRFTDFYILDPIMSIGIAIFILIHSLKSICKVFELLLKKTPRGIKINKLKNDLCKIDGVIEIHHIHVWSIDTYNNYATMHVVTSDNFNKIKKIIREELKKHNINHSTLELEDIYEHCNDKYCHLDASTSEHHHHHTH